MNKIKTILSALRQNITLGFQNPPQERFFNAPDIAYDCYVLGSGRSLLSLTKEEVNHINRSPFVLAFNKYILFYEKVGVVPTHYLLGDSGDKALLMFGETIKMCKEKPLDNVRFLFSRKLLRNVARRSDHLTLFDEDIRSRCFLITRNRWEVGGKWAASLKEPIYHYRGSLSGAVNISSLLNPGHDIKLLGVDLTDHHYFFHEEIERNKEKWGLFLNRLTPETTQHETIVEVKGIEGIQAVFPHMAQMVAAGGGKLLCCNPDSYLVTKNILEYRSII